MMIARLLILLVLSCWSPFVPGFISMTHKRASKDPVQTESQKVGLLCDAGALATSSGRAAMLTRGLDGWVPERLKSVGRQC